MNDLMPKNMAVMADTARVYTYKPRVKRKPSPPPRLITAHGETMTTKEWSIKTGVRKDTILERLYRGWDPDRAVMPR